DRKPLGLLSATEMSKLDSIDAAQGAVISGALVSAQRATAIQDLSVQEIPAEVAASGAEENAYYQHKGNALPTTKIAESCVVRGYHHWMVDMVAPHAPPDHPVRAKCKDCEKEFWRAARMKPRRA